MRRFLLPAVFSILAAAACNRETPGPPAATPARVDVLLSVLVVDQPEIAKAIGRVRGDWVNASGGDLRVTESSANEFSKYSQLDADIVIYPARYLGQLVEAEAVRPLRQSVMDDESVAFSTILPVVREAELAYGGEYYAVPFGSRVPAMARGTGSADDLELADGRDVRPAIEFLARAAPLAVHPNQVAVLFDLETMDARIAAPPFVRALEELASARPSLRADAADGADGSKWQLWPPVDPSSSKPDVRTEEVDASIPESDAIYNWDAESWEEAEDGVARTPLVGAESYIGSVARVSRNAPAAFRLLAWLAAEAGSGAGAVSIVPFRRGRADPSTESALSARNYLHVPRILQTDAYLAALDESVRRVLAGEVPPDEALREAADQWDEITDGVGRDRQRAAYRKHLNLH